MLKSLIKIFHDPEQDMIVRRYVPTYTDTRNLMIVFGVVQFLFGMVVGAILADWLMEF